MTRAHSNKAATKKSGGVVHADTRGSIGKAIERSDAGRERKKQEQIARTRAWAEKNTAERLKNHQLLEQEFDFLSQNYREMLTGPIGNVYGLRLSKNMGNYSAIGIIKMEIIGCGIDRRWPAIQVRGSTFDPIPASDIFLSMSSLFHKKMKIGAQSREVFAYQEELHAALCHHLKKEVAGMKPSWDISSQEIIAPQFNRSAPIAPRPLTPRPKPATSVPREVKQPVISIAPPAPSPEEEEVDVTGAIPFCIASFMRIKEKKSQLYVHRDACGKKVYFFAEHIGGAQAFRLLVADEGHELHGLFSLHYGKNVIRTNLLDLRKDTKPYGEVADVRNARECIRQYLVNVARGCGLRKKTARPAEQEQAA